MVLTCISHSLENSTVFFTKDRENFAASLPAEDIFDPQITLYIYINIV